MSEIEDLAGEFWSLYPDYTEMAKMAVKLRDEAVTKRTEECELAIQLIMFSGPNMQDGAKSINQALLDALHNIGVVKSKDTPTDNNYRDQVRVSGGCKP